MEELQPIFAQAQAGDVAAYAEIVRRFQDMAVGYAGAVLGDFHLAEDAAQEAFVEAFDGLDRVYAAAAFPAWLRRVVFKHCDRITRRRREETGLGAGVEAVSGGPDPLQAVEADADRALVHGALAALPEGERTVALLFYINDHSQREIGAFLDIPVSTVKNRLRAARKRLKAEVAEMVKRDLQQNRPSQNEAFSTQVQDYLTVLTVMHEKLLPMLEKTFAAATGAAVEVAIADIEHTTFLPYITASAERRAFYSFKVVPMGMRGMLLEYSLPLITDLLHASDGWDELGEDSGRPDDQMSMTRDQWALLHRDGGPIKASLENLETLWTPVVEGEMVVTDIMLETAPELVGADMGIDREADPEIVHITVDVRGEKCQGTVHLCYPVFTLEPVLPGLIQEN